MTARLREVRVIGTGWVDAMQVFETLDGAGGRVIGAHVRRDTSTGASTYHALVTVPDDEQEVA